MLTVVSFLHCGTDREPLPSISRSGSRFGLERRAAQSCHGTGTHESCSCSTSCTAVSSNRRYSPGFLISVGVLQITQGAAAILCWLCYPSILVYCAVCSLCKAFCLPWAVGCFSCSVFLSRSANSHKAGSVSLWASSTEQLSLMLHTLHYIRLSVQLNEVCTSLRCPRI